MQKSALWDLSSPDFISVIDELPFWSAPFGLELLDTVLLKKNMRALDIGCGTGFPLIELAQRLGPGSQVFGIDPWETAVERIRIKLKLYGINNVKISCGKAEKLDFQDNSLDLIVSNNGINNVEGPLEVLNECYRVLKHEGQLVLTVNLPGTFSRFYNVFEETLIEFHKLNKVNDLYAHIASRRKTLEENLKLFESAGLKVDTVTERSFSYRFHDGTAFFHHHFMRLAFLESCKKIVEDDDCEAIFSSIEQKLNLIANKEGELNLSVPFVCFDCRKE